MKAEIGFQRDWSDEGNGRVTDKLQLVINAQSSTEATSLLLFAKRMGLRYDESSGSLTIDEPVKSG